MDSDSHTPDRDEAREEHGGGILRRIEEKLNRLLGPREDDWHEREWAPLDSPFAYYEPGNPSPRLFGGPPGDATGWDPSLAGPRFDRIDVGSVGTHGVHPVSSFDGAQKPLFTPHSSAREYYLLMRAKRQAEDGQAAACYADYRQRKSTELDRDYADFCRDRQARFDEDFDAWRQKRAGRAPSASELSRNKTGKNAEDR